MAQLCMQKQLLLDTRKKIGLLDSAFFLHSYKSNFPLSTSIHFKSKDISINNKLSSFTIWIKISSGSGLFVTSGTQLLFKIFFNKTSSSISVTVELDWVYTCIYLPSSITPSLLFGLFMSKRLAWKQKKTTTKKTEKKVSVIILRNARNSLW